MSDMDAWERLRRPFEKDEIELLPKYTGKKDENGKVPRNAYRQCEECGKYHPIPCVHLNYVGHAGITDRLNEVDYRWNWEPLAFDGNGLPLIQSGGMWIKLTVLGVTRFGFGDAQGKTGPNATKEIIGDAIRNAAMRFGVGTYLWSKSEKSEHMLEFIDDGANDSGAAAQKQGEGADVPAEENLSILDVYRKSLTDAKNEADLGIKAVMDEVAKRLGKPPESYTTKDVTEACKIVEEIKQAALKEKK